MYIYKGEKDMTLLSIYPFLADGSKIVLKVAGTEHIVYSGLADEFPIRYMDGMIDTIQAVGNVFVITFYE